MRFTKKTADIIREGKALSLNEELGKVDEIIANMIRLLERNKPDDDKTFRECVFACLVHLRSVIVSHIGANSP